MTAPATAAADGLKNGATPTAIGRWVHHRRAQNKTGYQALAKESGIDQYRLQTCHRIYRELEPSLQWLVDQGELSLTQTRLLLRLPAAERPILAAAIVHEAAVNAAPLSANAIATFVKCRQAKPDTDCMATLSEVCGARFTTSPQIIAIGSPETLPLLYQAAWRRRESVADYCAQAPARMAQHDLQAAPAAATATSASAAIQQALNNLQAALQQAFPAPEPAPDHE